MVKKSALKTAGISMAGFQPRSKVFDGQTPEAGGGAPVPEPQREPGKPFTGVGSVMAAITREAEIAHELAGVQVQLQQATARLTALDGAVLVRAMDPRAIRRSRWANRIEAEFATVEFSQLKEEIASAGGNVQPIKVRALSGDSAAADGPVDALFDGQTPTHEIVFGHRRHRACLELGLPVNAIVVDKMDDRALFEAMDRENRGRKNLSAWEQGRMYDEAIRKGLYPSLRRLAESLGVNLSDASRAVQLAKLPKDIVLAFATPLDLQVRWAKPLADALQRDPEGTLARARTAMALGASRKPVEVLGLLLAAPAQPQPREITIRQGAKPLAVLKLAASGKLTVEFEAGAVADGQLDALARLIEGFVTARLPA